MKFAHFAKTAARDTVACSMLLPLLITGTVSGATPEPGSGQVHIIKDCGTFSGTPGSSYCTIVSSNVPYLPSGTRIYYDQITNGPSAGPTYLDSNVFVYVSPEQWAVGRCTVRNDNPLVPLGICTLSDGLGPLAGFSARVTVTYKPGGDGNLYSWDGTYLFRR
jgi:hypothetical protein